MWNETFDIRLETAMWFRNNTSSPPLLFFMSFSAINQKQLLPQFAPTRVVCKFCGMASFPRESQRYFEKSCRLALSDKIGSHILLTDYFFQSHKTPAETRVTRYNSGRQELWKWRRGAGVINWKETKIFFLFIWDTHRLACLSVEVKITCIACSNFLRFLPYWSRPSMILIISQHTKNYGRKLV